MNWESQASTIVSFFVLLAQQWMSLRRTFISVGQ